MHLQVEIDAHSGFCGGVIRAIGQAEDYLAAHPGEQLLSLGSIVHNEAELERLHGKGLRTITSLDGFSGGSVLIRAHGEPPRTYAQAAEQGIELIDCTCPVVLQLQRRIREAYARMQEAGGQVIIFGKVGHAEVLGLVGQVGGDALVVENMSMLSEAVDRGLVHPDGPVEVFSQTTKSPSEYAAICAALRSFVRGEVTVHDTICKQVSSRHAQLTAFARSHDVIIFVSGRESSNGKVLYGLCKGVNERSHQVGSAAEVDPSWLRDGDRVGVCGATSTPKWLLEAVAQKILHV